MARDREVHGRGRRTPIGQSGRRTRQEEHDKGEGLGCAIVLRKARRGRWRVWKQKARSRLKTRGAASR
jgi:hypothetical protein